MSYQPHPRTTSVDLSADPGPFDVIGDVHGCAAELIDLLQRLGYQSGGGRPWTSGQGRTAVFVGDLVDRGPANAEALRVAMDMVAGGTAFCVPGNHDLQLERYLTGLPIPVAYGLDATLAELEREPPTFTDDVLAFLRALKGHHVFDGGRLVVAHTGLPEALHGVDTPEVRQLAAYGVAEGEVDPDDRSRRHGWIAGYAGRAAVVYGHTSVGEAIWQGQTIDIDTGCVFGGRLTALRWPERELIAVPAHAAYAEGSRSFLASRSASERGSLSHR
jgi:diadenosine tetraphosphatase ApaH/serine/threonine PP2A family protein phosphatase